MPRAHLSSEVSRPVVQGNAADDQTAIDQLPNPRNPLDVDGSGLDGLDRILRCVAVSAHTLRNAGYPEATAFELVLAAKHVRRCMTGVDEAILKKNVRPQTSQGKPKITWSRELRDSRCCSRVVKNTRS